MCMCVCVGGYMGPGGGGGGGGVRVGVTLGHLAMWYVMSCSKARSPQIALAIRV